MSFVKKSTETGIGIKTGHQIDYLSKEEREERIRLIAHAKRDIVWWAETFFHIITLDRGLTKITLYPKQKEMLQFIADNTRIITLASRQTGKTTTYTIFCLWYATLFTDKKIMICANKMQTSIEIMDRIRKAYENLPFWIKPGILTYNKSEIEFSNGSVIRACATSSSAARSSSAGLLIVDEMAFIPKNIVDDFWASTIPIVSSSKTSKIVVVSTPNGADGLYYEIWQQANSKDARKNTEGWKPFRIHWWEAGSMRDEKWKALQIASIGMERWKQEFECDFLTSTTRRLIPDDVLEKYRIQFGELKAKNKEFIEGKKQHIMSEDETKLFEFAMWHEFDPLKTYAASGDAAEGGGGDSSVLYVWDITDLSDIKMCVKFESDKISLTEFAFVTSKILALYNNPYYICERNGVGSGYLDSLRITYGYQNIVTEGKNNEPGVYSQAYNKSKTCLWARDMMTTQGFGFTFYDKDLIDEFSTFVKKDTKNSFIIYTALAGAHDDHIMAFIWLTYLLLNEIIEKYFVVCETFTDSLGNNRAKIVMPLKAYSGDQIKAVTNDPMYKDFLEFKEELTRKYGLALKAENESANKDIFQMSKLNMDMYFGGDDGPSWNLPSLQAVMQNALDLNPNNRMPSFFVN